MKSAFIGQFHTISSNGYEVFNISASFIYAIIHIEQSESNNRNVPLQTVTADSMWGYKHKLFN